MEQAGITAAKNLEKKKKTGCGGIFFLDSQYWGDKNRKKDPWGLLPGQTSLNGKFQATEGPCLKVTAERDRGGHLTSCVHTFSVHTPPVTQNN